MVQDKRFDAWYPVILVLWRTVPECTHSISPVPVSTRTGTKRDPKKCAGSRNKKGRLERILLFGRMHPTLDL